jgi:hypothetical protein
VDWASCGRGFLVAVSASLVFGGVRRPRARSLVHIKWSVRDDVGFIELWHDGVPQTFGEPCAGQTRCTVRTLMPRGDGVYFKQGYDRRFDSEPVSRELLANMRRAAASSRARRHRNLDPR